MLAHRTGSPFVDEVTCILCVLSVFGLSHYLSYHSAQVYFCFSPFSSFSVWQEMVLQGYPYLTHADVSQLHTSINVLCHLAIDCPNMNNNSN